jgi:Kef-type K+ transport system membrane component KefB
VGQLAAIVLLFMAGLETDLTLFLEYVAPATVVALGGVIVPFTLGAWATVLFGFAPSMTHPAALFMGAVMTATSVGITARVLGDLDRLDIPEGVTVLAAAVVDDVLGIMALALVVNLTRHGSASAGELVILGGKAFGIWIVLTGAFVLGARHIERFIGSFKTRGAAVPLALAFCLLASAVADRFGLAMIIGAYAAGLGLSARPVGHRLREALHPVYQFLVPIFFALMGMLVDLSAMGQAVLFGLAVSLLAILGKILGCGLPALGVGFNRLGAARIGVGMLPRGEVALIIASVGLVEGAIGPVLFGVAVMMTLVTTLMAPPLLVPLFRRSASGLGRSSRG